MFNFFSKSKPTKPAIPEIMRRYRYTCSCGEHTDLEWCPKCGIRNTYKWNGSKGYPTRAKASSAITTSSSDSYVDMSSSFSSYSSDSSCSSDSGSCSSGGE